MNTDDRAIINAYQDAIRRFKREAVIDLDHSSNTFLSCFIVRLEKVLHGLGRTIPMNKASRFQLLFIKEGSGTKTIGKKQYVFQAPCLFIIPSGAPHGTVYNNENAVGYFLSFNLQFFFQPIFPRQCLAGKQIFHPRSTYLSLESSEIERLGSILEEIMDECAKEEELSEELAAIKIIELLILCERYYSRTYPPSASREPPLFFKFKEAVEEHYKENHTVNYYAALLHTHPNHLNNVVKKNSGLTAKKYIESMLGEEARHLLLSTGLSIKEIAFELGFSSPQHFFTFFKKNQQVSPLAFREKTL